MSYPVLLNLRIPWLTRVFYYLFIICSIITGILLSLYLLPSVSFPHNIKAGAFTLTACEAEYILFMIGVFGTPLFFVLYRNFRINRPGLLTLLPGKIEFDNLKTVTSYSIDEITDIACNDAMTDDGVPKGKLTIECKDKGRKVLSLTLSDYSLSGQLMNTLLDYRNIRVHVTSFSSDPGTLEP